MTRVAVNLLWCVPGQVGGSEQYLLRQLLGIRQAAENEFAVEAYAPRGLVAAHPWITSQFTVHESASGEQRRALRVWREATWFAANARGAAIVHHGGGTVPPRSPQPVVLTIHDLQYLDYPQYFTRTKLRYLAARLPASVQRARHIAVPSHYVKQTVVERLGVAPERVSVVRHGIEATLGQTRTSERELRERFGVGAAHVLVYPAITHPHKNHAFLVDLLAGPLRQLDVQVVLAGGVGRAHDSLQRCISENQLADRIKLVGRLDDRDRDGLLSMATALVFPSSYEGFGAPIIEAMALGAPVIAANSTALPEVVGDAGHALPLDLEAWASAVNDVITRRTMWQERGRVRASQFQAIDSGRDLAAVYRRVMAGA
ncbi:MAG: glycosyltransferase family 4 protein [Ilumatobacteraceae bacterium]|nr:glycosyltransferase family 4 protein [Ilumatobacteraceae bacterium]